MKELLIKNGIIYKNNKLIKRDILCRDKLIIEISEDILLNNNYDFIDASNFIIAPGFIDMHTHLREPGFEYKEDINTGTMAAIAGGFTCVCAMPNLNPVPDDLNKLKVQKKIIKKNAKCDVLNFMSITKNRLGHEIISFDNIKNACVGISDDGNGIQDENIMAEAMKKAAEKNILISAHCEDKNYIKKNACINNCEYAKKNNLIGINNKSEFKQIERDIKLLEKYNARYHVCHVSCRESIKLIKKAKEKKLKLTCEATPHHLLLCDDDISCDDGKFKMAPPLRSREDQKELLKAIKNGIIDIIATDHAPHSNKEKSLGLEKSLMGVTGLECAFAVLYNDLVFKLKIISLERLIYLLSIGPSKILNISCEINIGNRANLVLLNTKKIWRINSKNFFSKGKSTPFDNKKVIGKVFGTIFNGNLIYKDIN